MSKLKSPILFSKHFDISEETLSKAGLIDPFLNVDTQLFIDPVLLAKSSNNIIQEEAVDRFRTHFSNLVRILDISEKEGDAAWRGAQKLLNLDEPAQTGLGYGSTGRSGSSRPEELRDAILRTIKNIVRLGSKDPEMISLMGFFEEKVGPDTISDLTTRVISRDLEKITEEFCKANAIPVKRIDADQSHELPYFRENNRVEKPIVLVPQDIVRDLPVANDWSDVNAAISANRRIRDRVNILLAGIAQPTITERKDALKKAATQSAELFDLFLQSIKDFATHYDPNKDALGYYKLKSLLQSDLSLFKSDHKFDFGTGPEAVLALVRETIFLFKHHVENGNLWEELWINGKPKRERAAQLIYYALADCFCIANNVDISPEANMGGGPIDFKFSKGYFARVLVEMKRSSGTVKHGYEKQLEHYLDAARSFYGIFVVLDFGNLDNKLDQIMAIRNNRIANGQRASEIIVIDATPKASASKRQ